MPMYRGKRGNPIVFAGAYRPRIMAQRGMAGCKTVVAENRDKVSIVEMDDDHVLRDIDTEEDYRNLIEQTPAGEANGHQA